MGWLGRRGESTDRRPTLLFVVAIGCVNLSDDGESPTASGTSTGPELGAGNTTRTGGLSSSSEGSSTSADGTASETTATMTVGDDAGSSTGAPEPTGCQLGPGPEWCRFPDCIGWGDEICSQTNAPSSVGYEDGVCIAEAPPECVECVGTDWVNPNNSLHICGPHILEEDCTALSGFSCVDLAYSGAYAGFIGPAWDCVHIRCRAACPIPFTGHEVIWTCT